MGDYGFSGAGEQGGTEENFNCGRENEVTNRLPNLGGSSSNKTVYTLDEGILYHIKGRSLRDIPLLKGKEWKFCMYVGNENLPRLGGNWLTFGQANSKGIIRLRIPIEGYSLDEEGEWVGADKGVYWQRILPERSHTPIVNAFLEKYKRLIDQRLGSDSRTRDAYDGIVTKMIRCEKAELRLRELVREKDDLEKSIRGLENFNIENSIGFMKTGLDDLGRVKTG
jgi:hypothetical protein